MKTSIFSFDLPPGQIAATPAVERGASRLLILDRQTGKRRHAAFADIVETIPQNALLVLNTSRVRKARLTVLRGKNGQKAEVLCLSPDPNGGWRCLLGGMKRPKSGEQILLPDGQPAAVLEGAPGEWLLRTENPLDEAFFERHGAIPLPPYLRREPRAEDEVRYQTVYAGLQGSAAAPTAGLHFTPEVLKALQNRGVEICEVVLHVGLGTFLPVKSELVQEHHMHEEAWFIQPETASRLTQAVWQGRPIVATGTTSARVLESAWTGESFACGWNKTAAFFVPGYRFRVVSSLLTNFHTPKSSLLMLVCAFAGTRLLLESYDEAVRLGYRFFSYGDAMLIR